MPVAGGGRRRWVWGVVLFAAVGTGNVLGYDRPAAAACASVTDVTDAGAVGFTGVVAEVVVPDSGADDGAIATFTVERWDSGGGPAQAAVIVNSASDGAEFVAWGDDRPVVLEGERWHMIVRGDGDGDFESACTLSTRLAAAAPSATSLAATVALPSFRRGVVAVIVLAVAAILVALGRHRSRADRQEDVG